MPRSTFSLSNDPLMVTMANLLKADIAHGLVRRVSEREIAHARAEARMLDTHPAVRALRNSFVISNEELK